MATLIQTTLTAAVTARTTNFPVASVTGISGPTSGFMQKMYIIDPGSMRGELVTVTATPSGLIVPVSRLDMFRAPHPTGAIVLIASVDPLIPGFQEFNPIGRGTNNPQPLATTTPWVNIATGEQWIYSALSDQWAPGWNNPLPVSAPSAVQTIPAGPMTPGSRLFHTDTGTAAMTGIVTPVGCSGGNFTIIPGGAFTWTVGDGSIGVAGTAVVGKALVFTKDSLAGIWYPSYVA